MSRMKRSDGPLNAKAEFRSKTLEKAYYEGQINTSKHFIRYVIWGVGAVFLAIGIFDYFYNDEFIIFFHSFIVRCIVFLFATISFLVMSKTKRATFARVAITFFPVVLVLGYIYILAHQSAQGLANQAMAIMTIVFCTTIMPNRWINLVFIDTCIVVFFLAFSTTYITTAVLSDYVEITIYLTFVLIFSLIVEYRSNIIKREKYLWEMQLQEESTTDKLTGTYNRLWFDRTVTEWCIEKGKQQIFSLVLIDIDEFKSVNDTYGHLVGDQVLIDMAKVVQSSVRSTDMLARWGGEEFALLLPGASIEKAVEIAEAIRKNVEQYAFAVVGRITVSIGVTFFKEGDKLDSLVKGADVMLYEAKRAGKNCVRPLSLLSTQE